MMSDPQWRLANRVVPLKNNGPRTTDTSPSQLAAVQRVQAALGLGLAGPAAGALVLAGGDGASARPAADRRIALVVQRVVGDLVRHDERPDVARVPAQEWVDLD